MIKLIFYLMLGGTVLILGIFLGFYLMQDYLIFRGDKLPADHEFQFGSRYEERYFETPDGAKINAVMFRSQKGRGLVFYHHGNAGNLQGWARMHNNFTRLGYDVLFYDYRGYGKSTGKITRESTIQQDAAMIYQELLNEYREEEIVIYGTSLGSGIASRLASVYHPKLLILETPYYSFLSLVKYHYAFLPARLITKYRFRTHKFVKKANCPVHLFHGTDDAVIPIEASERLEALSDKVSLTVIEGGVHSNLPEYDRYHSTLAKIL